MFNRPPRLPVPLPNEAVRIPDPPDLPSPPSNMNWITLAITAGVTFFGAILVAVLLKNALYLMMMVFTVGSVAASIASFFVGKRKYRKALSLALQQYDLKIAAAKERLEHLRAVQQKLLSQINPDLGECLARAQRKDSRLGERRPGHVDFLAFRIGSGRVPSSVQIETPNPSKLPRELGDCLTAVNQLSSEFATVPDAPITVCLGDSGHLGIVGSESDVAGLARAILSHSTVHHWPTEVQVAVVCESGQQAKWWWANYLPNLWERMPIGEITQLKPGASHGDVARILEDEIDWRRKASEDYRGSGQASAAPDILPKLIIAFDHIITPLAYPAVQKLLDDSDGTLGIYGLFLEGSVQEVPGECGAVLELGSDVVHYVQSGTMGYPMEVRADPPFEYQEAEILARALSGVDWLRVDRIGGPPEQIAFLDMFGSRDLDLLPIESWWENGSPFGYLRTPIGRTSPTGNLWLDLNDRDDAHGPHGLIGGTTGSGKSEVLKTIALSLALTHHPHDLNFALVDFKGGAAFNELMHLPHTVGVITDIETHAGYCLRMLQALTGEIEFRKRVIEEARARFGLARSHIDDYRLLPVRRLLPRLIIIFDEFAAFKERFPEESKALINIARQGRSLGVHLILSTQTLSTIDENIRQNSRFRILLRVASESDSREIIGTGAAHRIQRRGRAYFSTGVPAEFQSAYAGYAYLSVHENSIPDDAIIRRWLDGKQEVLFPPNWSEGHAHPDERGNPPTEAQAVIERLRQLASKLGLKEPRRIWPDPLSEALSLPELMSHHESGGWDGQTWLPAEVPFAPVLGRYDHPLKQRQPVYRFCATEGDGHLLVFGQPGSGKSTLLQTLVVGLARMHSPREVWIYILDFGGQASMKAVEALPHVGSVITRTETERIDRLFQMASSEITRRGELFRKTGVNDLVSYNAKVSPSLRLPAIFVLIDGFGAFRRTFQADDPSLYHQPSAFLSGGRSAGVHLVITANQWSELDDTISGNLNTMLTFKVSSAAEFRNIVGHVSDHDLRTEVGVSTPPGRGFLRGSPPLEFQAALPVDGVTDEERLGELASLMTKMSAACEEAGIEPAPGIASLPSSATLDSVLAKWETKGARSDISPFGLDYETLEPTGMPLRTDGPGFMVAGAAPQAGKSSFLIAWLLSEALHHPYHRLQFVIVGFHSPSLAPLMNMPHVLQFIGLKSDLGEVLHRLTAEIDRRQKHFEEAYRANPLVFDQSGIMERFPLLVVVVDDYEAFAHRCDSQDLEVLGGFLTRGCDLGARVVVADDVARLGSRPFSDSLFRRIKTDCCGVLLGGAQGLGQLFDNVMVAPELRRLTLPLGRGFLVRRGRARLFQAAQFWAGGEGPANAIQRYVRRLQDDAQGHRASWIE